jgi:hypothetical protein
MTRKANEPVLDLIELEVTRIVSTLNALDGLGVAIDIRLSPDEALCFADQDEMRSLLPVESIVEAEVGLSGAWVEEFALRTMLARLCEWELPIRPGVGQGMIAGIPAKVWLPEGTNEALLIVGTVFAHEMQERFA